MNQFITRLARRSLITGTIAGVATAVASSLAGKQETGSYSAPLNATSHVLWGDVASTQDGPSLKFTLTGFLLNYGAAIFWAALYEALFASPSKGAEPSPLKPLLGATALTAGAYLTDYHVVPTRVTPGFESRLSGKSLLAIYGVLALALATRTLMAPRH